MVFQLSDKVQQGIRIRGSNNRQKVILVHPVQGGGPGGQGSGSGKMTGEIL